MEELIIIKDNKGLREVINYLKDKDFVAYDTETTGLDQDCKVIGISLSAETNIGYYIILSAWDKEKKQLVDLETTSEIKNIIEILLSKSLIMHNSVFDCRVTRTNFGIDLMPALHTDTMELAHLLNENRKVGLKDLSYTEFGESSVKEQKEMKESIVANGGKITKECYELYKADAELIARYGAKDAILTFNLFSRFVPDLFNEKLDKFFYEEESMPLMRGPTYKMNTVGLKVDINKIKQLEENLKLECLRLKEEIITEITPLVSEKWPGTKPKNTFNINSGEQLSWLLFTKLGNEFLRLTKKGKEIAKTVGDNKIPYHSAAKKAFIKNLIDAKMKPEKYMESSASSLEKFRHKYEWVDKLLKFKKMDKILNTYVIGIQKRMKYGIIHPSFLQHGTTSGRYSSKDPNFQNLPRDDKQVKSCIIPREGMVFVGADYAQLEPRIFASFAQDPLLLNCFEKGEDEDFYSVIGISVFNKHNTSADKNANNYFGKVYKPLRQIAKGIALAATYGTTAYKLASILVDECGNALEVDQCKKIIEDYFFAYPGVKEFMLSCHEQAKKHGAVHNLFGRPRRIQRAKIISQMYPKKAHHELPYEIRKLLNLAVNHKVQSTAASVVNRSALSLQNALEAEKLKANIVLQVHDSLIVECPKEDATKVATLMKFHMENTVKLDGVRLVAEPQIGNSLAEV